MEGGQEGGLEGREMKVETTHSMVQREKLAPWPSTLCEMGRILRATAQPQQDIPSHSGRWGRWAITGKPEQC